MSQYHLKKATDGQFYFVLKAYNAETILKREMYTTRQGCENGIESVKRNSPNDANYRRLTANNGKYYFNLVAGNNQVIGTSEMYNSTAARDNGIASVKVNGPVAQTADMT